MNMGTSYLTLLAMLGIPILVFMTKPCVHKSQKVSKAHNWIGPPLRGNMWLRFVMEASLDIFITGTVNLILFHELEYVPMNSSFYILNAISLFVLYPLAGLFPFFVLGFYMFNFVNWDEKHYKARYGTVLEGLRKDKRSSLLYPLTFSIRRILFTIVAIITPKLFFVQMLFVFITATFQIWYLITYKPFVEPLV